MLAILMDSTPYEDNALMVNVFMSKGTYWLPSSVCINRSNV